MVSQSSNRQEEGAHQEANECVYGLGASSSPCDVKTVSEPSELRAQQVAGKALEVSTLETFLSLDNNKLMKGEQFSR